MKSTVHVSFAVLLTGLAYFTSSLPNQYPYPHHQHVIQRNQLNNIVNPFLYKLERALNMSGPLCPVLPFTLRETVIRDLGQTSETFKKNCIRYDLEHQTEGVLSPLTALNKSIYYAFFYYKKSAGDQSHILEEIEKVDPIGLNAYLTKKNIENSSPNFMESVMEFRETMYDRVRLFNMRSNNSYITIFNENSNRTFYRVRNDIRRQIATEYEPIKIETLDLFTDMVSEQLRPGMKMYRMNVFDDAQYKLHTMSDLDDVQISYGEPHGLGSDHAICIYYMASHRKVYIYDSDMKFILDERQRRNIKKRYPYHWGIELKRPTALQGDNPTCALFAIAYATMLLTGDDPAVTQVKINKVYGDETLYIRIHLLNMLVNQKLAAFK